MNVHHLIDCIHCLDIAIEATFEPGVGFCKREGCLWGVGNN